MATKKKKAAVKKPGPQCACIQTLDAVLSKEHPNVMVDAAVSITMGAVLTIPLTKKVGAPRGTKVPTMVANYCPLCGKKYNK